MTRSAYSEPVVSPPPPPPPPGPTVMAGEDSASVAMRAPAIMTPDFRGFIDCLSSPQACCHTWHASRGGLRPEGHAGIDKHLGGRAGVAALPSPMWNGLE